MSILTSVQTTAMMKPWAVVALSCALAGVTSAQPPAKPTPEKVIVIDLGGGGKLALVRVEPGEFLMGSPESEPKAPPDQKPQRRVKITRSFYLGKFEVTVAQFRAFVTDTSYVTSAEKDRDPANWRRTGFDQTDTHPAVKVSWYDAKAFCEWLLKHPKAKHLNLREVRLPSEAEWEYACRAGTTTRFSSGDNDLDLRGYANVADDSARRYYGRKHIGNFEPWDDGCIFTAPVGTYKPNRFGLYDMHGNVWEWSEDDYGPYQGMEATDPLRSTKDPQGRNIRVCRGGSYQSPAGTAASAVRLARFAANSGYSSTAIGFRVLTRVE